MGFGFSAPVWYKVRHPQFSTRRAYRALGYECYSETAWASLVFILETGHTWAVLNHRCTALPVTADWTLIDHQQYSRPLTNEEELFPWATKSSVSNPDLDVDL
jgi:hypothetical protein